MAQRLTLGLALLLLTGCLGQANGSGPGQTDAKRQMVSIAASGKIWAWRDDDTSRSGQLFFDIRDKAADELRSALINAEPTIGVIPVSITIGGTSWDTAIVDASSHDGYLLEIDPSVAASENLSAGSIVELTIQVRG